MPRDVERTELSATPQEGLLARVIRALRRFAPAAIASICIMPSAWAIPTTTLSPLGPQSTIALSRAATNGAFAVDYDFTLATAASAIYQTGRLNIVIDPIFGTLRINQFSAQLFLLIGDAVSGSALATGVDSGHPSFVLSNDFFAANLAPGDYRLTLGGIDENSGYDGVFRVTPPAQVQLTSKLPEPQSWALLLIALGSIMLAHRQPTSRRLRLPASRVA